MRTHHVLVLEYVAGGELLEVVNSDEQHAELSEALLHRIWRELVSAVEWIHARFVVHRDIKLESSCSASPMSIPLPLMLLDSDRYSLDDQPIHLPAT